MRVALIGDNSIEMIEQVLNIWNNGDCVVLVDWRIPYNSIVEMLESADVRKCYIESKLFENNKPKTDITDIEFLPYLVSEKRIKIIPEEICNKYQQSNSGAEALILFSSGTTGKSKGVILSHYAISKNAEEVYKYMKLTPNDTMYIQKTLCHSSTFVCELLVALRYHVRMYIAPTVTTPGMILKNIVENSITVTCLNPTLLKLITFATEKEKYELSGLKKIYCSGAVLDTNLLERAKRVFQNVDILNVYGLTEAGPRVAAQIPNLYDSAGSVGKVLDCATVKITDDQGNAKNVNEQGIIYVKTECKYIGYANLKNKTNEEEWINTKDIGYFNENNELFVLGRADNMINIDSHNVFVEEIEQRIVSMKEIEDCLIYGITNENDNNILCCDYVGEMEENKKIIEYLRDYLSSYEIPRKYNKVDSIEYTLNGKKKRTKH